MRIAAFAHPAYLVERDIIRPFVLVTQIKDRILYFDHITSKNRTLAAADIHSLAL